MSPINGTTPSATEDEYLEITFEEVKNEEIYELRERVNKMEAALARAPVQIRRRTRATGRVLGIWF